MDIDVFKNKKLVLLVAISILIIGLGFFLWKRHEFRREKIIKAFNIIEIGASRKEVLYYSGMPQEIEICEKPLAVDVSNGECMEIYWYHSFMERWGYSFNKNGIVINKTHNFSY